MTDLDLFEKLAQKNSIVPKPTTEERVAELEKEKQSDSQRISELETLVLQMGGII